MGSWLAGWVSGVLGASHLVVLPSPWFALCLAACGIAASACRGLFPALLGGICLGLALGVFSGHHHQANRLPVDCVREVLQVSGRIDSLPVVTRLGEAQRQQRFEFVLERVEPARCRGPERVQLAYYGDARLAPGQRWRLQVRLKRPWGQVNPAASSRQAWYAQAGLDATGSVTSRPPQRLGASDALDAAHHRLRAKVSQALARLPLAGDTAAVLAAVTVADRSGLDAGLWRVFQRFGVTHMLVISGLHIGLVAGLGFALGRGLGWPAGRLGAIRGASFLPGGVALLCAAGYSALAGFSLPTQRALAMLVCIVAAGWAGRLAGSWRNLWLAAAVVLGLNPLAGLGSGFWLSCLAVACLLWQAQWRAGASFWRTALRTHLFMSLAMLPLSSWWFGGASLVAAPANLLLVPLLGLYVIPLALLGTGLLLLESAWALPLWRAAAWPLDYLLPAGRLVVANHADGLYRFLNPGPMANLLAALAVGAAVIPGAWRARLWAPVLLMPLLLPPRMAVTATPEAVHLLFLDVGQGTSVLVYDRDHALLYDTGGGVPGVYSQAENVLLPLLRSRGIRRLDTLVLSHGDADHSAGLRPLQRALPVDRLWVGADLAYLPGAATCIAGKAQSWGRAVRWRVLAPAAERGLTRNNGSCVLQLWIHGRAVLLSGDIDVDRERTLVRRWGPALRSDWLLAAHHGSRSSSSHALLKTVRPAHVVFSHGYANHFGHPHAAVLARFGGYGARRWSTARHGAIELVLEPAAAPRIITHRQRQARYWQ